MRLARRAGRVVIGVALTGDAVRKGRADAVLVADDLSSHRREKLIARWLESRVPIYGGWTKDELGELAGRPAVAVLAISDPHIAAGLSQIARPPAADEGEE